MNAIHEIIYHSSPWLHYIRRLCCCCFCVYDAVSSRNIQLNVCVCAVFLLIAYASLSFRWVFHFMRLLSFRNIVHFTHFRWLKLANLRRSNAFCKLLSEVDSHLFSSCDWLGWISTMCLKHFCRQNKIPHSYSILHFVCLLRNQYVQSSYKILRNRSKSPWHGDSTTEWKKEKKDDDNNNSNDVDKGYQYSN